MVSIQEINNIKDWAYVIHIGEYDAIWIHGIACYIKDDCAIYFESFGGEHIINKIKKFIGNQNIIANIYKIQIYDLIMCEYFWSGFINFMLDNKSFTDFIGILSSHDYKQIDKKYLSIFNKCNILYIIMEKSYKFVNFYPYITTNID